MVNANTEEVIAPVAWYSAFFSKMENKLTGRKIPGIRRACEEAVASHKAIEHKWLTVVGWDCMLTDKDEFTFFEGNFAGARTPRVMFLNWDNFTYMMRTYFWPFGSANNITPYD